MRRTAVSAWILVMAAAAILAAPAAAAERTCRPTPPDSLGPFYVPGAPERSQTGRGLLVFGVVRSEDCRPVSGARIEWWSATPQGEYDAAHRATQRADGAGRYRYETDFPGRYPGRPPHLHVKVTAPGHRPLVAQIYPTPGQASVPVDLILAKE